jgi:hypothetical protein
MMSLVVILVGLVSGGREAIVFIVILVLIQEDVLAIHSVLMKEELKIVGHLCLVLTTITFASQ